MERSRCYGEVVVEGRSERRYTRDGEFLIVYGTLSKCYVLNAQLI